MDTIALSIFKNADVSYLLTTHALHYNTEFMSTHTLFVCTTCATMRLGAQAKSDGQRLLEQLTELAQGWELQEQFAIRAVKCMFVCEKSCAVSLAAAGKYTYLFGHLRDEDSAEAILDCARSYYAHPEGLLPYGVRPEALKTNVLARIPPQLVGQAECQAESEKHPTLNLS
jgi:predicted metal-binding protein